MNQDCLKILNDEEKVKHSMYGVDSTFSIESGKYKIPMQLRICFGCFTKSFTESREATIRVRMYKKPIPNNSNGYKIISVTPFTLEEIVSYLNDIRKIMPFEFDIVEDEGPECLDTLCPAALNIKNNSSEESKHFYDITYHIDGPHIAHMFILAMQRFLYADSFYLALAMKIKNGNFGFENTNIFNILNCVLSTVDSDDHGGDMHHFDYSNFLLLMDSKTLNKIFISAEKAAKKNGDSHCADMYSVLGTCTVSIPHPKRQAAHKLTCDIQRRLLGLAEDSDSQSKKMIDDAIDDIVFNLTALREATYSDSTRKRMESMINNDRYYSYDNTYPSGDNLDTKTGVKMLNPKYLKD